MDKEVKEKNKKGKRFSTFSLLANAIALFAVLMFVILLYFSHDNFTAVKNGNEPTGYKNVKTYVKSGRNVKVYNYTFYKIVVVKYAGVETYELKPIFTSDY